MANARWLIIQRAHHHLKYIVRHRGRGLTNSPLFSHVATGSHCCCRNFRPSISPGDWSAMMRVVLPMRIDGKDLFAHHKTMSDIRGLPSPHQARSQTQRRPGRFSRQTTRGTFRAWRCRSVSADQAWSSPRGIARQTSGFAQPSGWESHGSFHGCLRAPGFSLPATTRSATGCASAHRQESQFAGRIRCFPASDQRPAFMPL